MCALFVLSACTAESRYLVLATHAAVLGVLLCLDGTSLHSNHEISCECQLDKSRNRSLPVAVVPKMQRFVMSLPLANNPAQTVSLTLANMRRDSLQTFPCLLHCGAATCRIQQVLCSSSNAEEPPANHFTCHHGFPILHAAVATSFVYAKSSQLKLEKII